MCAHWIISLLREREKSKFYVINRKEWERNIAELTARRITAFQWMYCTGYSAFLILCTIIWPQIQVDAEIPKAQIQLDTESSKGITSKISITVEIIFTVFAMVRWWQLS